MTESVTKEVPTDEFDYASIAPDISHIETENDDPVDNLFSAKQQRLLVEPLYTSWNPEQFFLADANVGVFSAINRPPLVPDMFLSLDVEPQEDWWKKEGRSYFLWVYGKPPDAVVEVVSNREGGEAARKLREYARMGVPYYAIFDPQNNVQEQLLVVYELVAGEYLPRPDFRMERIQLSLQVWEGEYEMYQAQWLRWADLNGTLMMTGAELSAQEQQRADQEQQRADQEQQRADQERERAEKLAARLRELGIDPDSI